MRLPADIVSALAGAFRLMRFDAGGMERFDLSADGFWRSFLAMIPVAPTYALVVWVDLARREEPVNAAWAVLVSSVAYLLGWAAFPVAAVWITRLLGLTGRYVALIVAYNWISVPQSLAFAGAIVLDTWGRLPGPVGPWIAIGATIYVLSCQWFAARVALAAPPFTTTGVVILQIVIGELIMLSANRLI